MADVGAVWHLRYRAASASAYKWEVVGASAVGMGVATTQSASLASSTYGVVNADSPKVTVPLAGNYNVLHIALALADASANTSVEATVKINSATPATTSYLCSVYQVPVSEWQNLSGQGPETFAKDDALTHVYRQRSGSTKTVYRYAASLFITPIRVG